MRPRPVRLLMLNTAIVALQGGDMFGVSRTVDHAVYTLLNSAAVILWRLNAAIISMSMFGYATQDWLTNRHDGGVWHVLEMMAGPDGFAGEKVWTLLLGLALMLFGLAKVVRPFVRNFNPVDLGKLLLFGVVSYAVIQQGTTLMIAVEAWRSDLGGWMYEGVAASATVNIDAPDTSGSGEPMYPPREMDGQSPIRGWEAVSSSYFLAQSEAELNSNIPPPDFRKAYCLYDPDRAINDQADENAQGCSPRRAWDEWDVVSTGVITQVYGIELPIALGISLPIMQEHPENRELGIRQAQAGVARLALGPLVALYPVIEANISLMLALSAAILYLTLPIMLLFGFFVATEPLVRQLLLRVVNVMVNTIILNGLIALFLLLLMEASLNGSLTGYLGVVGVAVIGGIILSRVAAGTLKETMSAAMSAVGGAWMGAATGTMGKEVAGAARGALGAAKLAGMGALVGAAGMSAFDLAEPALHGARSGLRDLDYAAPGTEDGLQKQAGHLPGPLAKLAQGGLDTQEAVGGDPGQLSSAWYPADPAGHGREGGRFSEMERSQPAAWERENGSWLPVMAGGALLAGGAAMDINPTNGYGNEPKNNPTERYSQAERLAVWQAGAEIAGRPEYRQPDGTLNAAGVTVVAEQLSMQGHAAFQGEAGAQDLALLLGAQADNGMARGWGAPEARVGRVDSWLEAAYRARESGRGQSQTLEAGRSLFGEELGRDMETAVSRHSRPDAENVVRATRQAALNLPPAAMMTNGELTEAGRAAIRAELGEAAIGSFAGPQGYQDLEALATAAMQRDMTVGGGLFYRHLATAESWEPPAETVPVRLGLDPAASGPHYSSLNRFTQVSEAAGLTPALREQLLTEAGSEAGVTPALERQISAALARQAARGQGAALSVGQVIAGARAVPAALSGPQLRGGGSASLPEAGAVAAGEEASRPDSKQDDDGTVRLPAATEQAGASVAMLSAAGAAEKRSEARDMADQLRRVVSEIRSPAPAPGDGPALREGRATAAIGNIDGGLPDGNQPEESGGEVDGGGPAGALPDGWKGEAGMVLMGDPANRNATGGVVDLSEAASWENPNSAGADDTPASEADSNEVASEAHSNEAASEADSVESRGSESHPDAPGMAAVADTSEPEQLPPDTQSGEVQENDRI
jgi:hypothetical protein